MWRGKRRGYNTENRKLRNKTLSKIFFNKDERKKKVFSVAVPSFYIDDLVPLVLSLILNILCHKKLLLLDLWPECYFYNTFLPSL